MAFDGRRLAFVIHSEDRRRAAAVLVTDGRGVASHRVPLEDARYGSAVAFVKTGEATELWVFNGGSRIERFALPAGGSSRAINP